MSWGRRMNFTGYGVVIPNAVDTRKFSKSYNYIEIKDVQDQLGKKPGEVWLITTSRLVEKNGVDDVIHAVAQLPSEIHFAILGIGPDEEKLKKLTYELKISKRIHFIGQVTHEMIPKYLKACDIFIRPSRSEGMGNSFVEAMAARLPVIATTEGGLSDFIFDLKTAYECKKDNPESIVLAVKRVLSDEERKEKILNTAFEMVAEKYDWNLIAKRMQEEVFAKI
jgi:glycosyltransferase involved in cell wall biosynthesis